MRPIVFIRTWITSVSESRIANILSIILFLAFPVLINQLIVEALLPQHIFLALFIWIIGAVFLYFTFKSIWPSLYNTKYFGWLGILLSLSVGLFVFIITAQILFSRSGLLAGVFWIGWGVILLRRLLSLVIFSNRKYLAWIAVTAFFGQVF